MKCSHVRCKVCQVVCSDKAFNGTCKKCRNLIEEERVDDGESDTILSERYERLVVQNSKTGVRYLKCDKCQFSCRAVAYVFDKHYKSHLDDNVIIMREKDIVDLIIPEPSTSKDQRGLMCDICDKPFGTAKALAAHGKKHASKMFSCSVCGLAFETSFRLKNHQKMHNTKGVCFACNLCDKCFTTKPGYNYHLKTVHGIVNKIIVESPKVKQNSDGPSPKVKQSTDGPVHDVVPKTAPTSEKSRSDDKPFVCDRCGKKFRLKLSLKEHIMIEFGLKDCVCDVCGKKYVSKAYLKKHERIHLMHDGIIEGYGCDICGKKYHEKWRMKEHQRNSHFGKSDNLRCHLCDQMFTKRFLKDVHMRTAHKDQIQAYQCDFCDQKFNEKCLLKLHIQAIHRINVEKKGKRVVTVDATSDELKLLLQRRDQPSSKSKQPRTKPFQCETRLKPFPCEDCGKRFASKFALNNHINAKLNLRKYVCEVCGRRFNYSMGLREHCITHHAEKEFICALCSKEFPTKKRYREHVLLHSSDQPYVCKCGSAFKVKPYLMKHMKRCGLIAQKK